MTGQKSSAKKSLYVFLSSMLGILLFLVIHRIIVFLYLVLAGVRFTPGSEGTYLVFLAFDYFTLIIILMLGAWYGIWLGMYWYEKVYEEESHKGVVDYIVNNYWPRRKTTLNLKSKIAATQQKLETDLWELEGLTENLTRVKVKPRSIKKRIVRKTAPKRLKKTK